MSIRIISVGKKHEAWVSVGIERYQERLRKPFDVKWVLLPHSARESDMARQEESGRILTRLDGGDFVILLDERGGSIDSPSFSDLLTRGFQTHARVTILIGGAYGVDEEVRERADKVLSLSSLVFPHQLVRLIVTEQLYRAQEIAGKRPYHHA